MRIPSSNSSSHQPSDADELVSWLLMSSTGACTSNACCIRHPRACESPAQHVVTSARHASVAHITFFGFAGSDHVAKEITRSVYSLARVCRRGQPRVLVITDSADLQLEMRSAFHGLGTMLASKSAVTPDIRIDLVRREWVTNRFAESGLHRLAHHSGWGGYSKMIAADLLPRSLNFTLLIDTDTIFAADIGQLWAFAGNPFPSYSGPPFLPVSSPRPHAQSLALLQAGCRGSMCWRRSGLRGRKGLACTASG